MEEDPIYTCIVPLPEHPLILKMNGCGCQETNVITLLRYDPTTQRIQNLHHLVQHLQSFRKMFPGTAR